MPLPASADPEPSQNEVSDISNGGNGTRNHNFFSVKSPTYNHGYQHTSSSTAGGTTSIQNAMCKNVTVCNITQNVSPAAETATPHETTIVEKNGEPKAQDTGPAAPDNANALLGLYPLGLLRTASTPAAPSSSGVTDHSAPDAGERAIRSSAEAGHHPGGFVHRRGHRARSQQAAR